MLRPLPMLPSSAVLQPPPTRTSNTCSATIASSGPHHCRMRAGLVHASKSFSGLAEIVRASVSTRSSVPVGIGLAPLGSIAVFHQPLQPVERGLPELSVALEPVLHLAEAVGARPEHAELPVDPPLDDARLLEYPEM